MIQQFQYDQTAFGAEEPLYENAGSSPKPEKAELKKPNSGKVILVFLLILAVIGGWYVFSRSTQVIQPGDEKATPTPTKDQQAVPSSVDQLFLELDQSLLEADPSINLYPFPPISEDILVSPKQ
jgi:hypothetical protein